jgi:type IX secretion system PorP/SprF family membrane protein
MKSRLVIIAFCFCATAFFTDSYGQLTNPSTPFFNYYYDYKLFNPAFTGTKARHTITTVYSGFPSDNAGSRFYGSYEMNIEAINSGVGAAFTHDNLGYYSSSLAGLFYSRQFTFNENSGLRIGTQMFYRTQTTDYSQLIIGGFTDPFLGSGKETTNNFNFDMGIVYYNKYATIGASLQNALNSGTSQPYINVIAERQFKISNSLILTPSILLLTDFSQSQFSVNNTFEIAQWILLGAGYTTFDSGYDDLSFNEGLNIKNRVQIVTHLYSKQNQDYVSPFFSGRFFEIMVRATLPEKTFPTFSE